MTCIAGIAQKGKVWMGADSMAVSSDLVYSAPGKLFRRGDFIIGTCGDHRYKELVAYAAELKLPDEDEDMSRYIATDFAKSIRKAAQDYGWMKQENSQDLLDGRLLIGARGSIFLLDGVLSHLRIDEGFAAIGSGGMVAMGSLYESRDLQPQERLERALIAAEALTECVRRPFTFDSM